MDWNQVIDFFGDSDDISMTEKTERTAKALGCTRQAVLGWWDRGIPAPRQAQIELASGGRFCAEERPWER